MAKIYEVRGTITIEVFKRVKANDEDEAMELADYHFAGLTEYCGNGGTDKLIGVQESSESVQLCGDYVDWQEAYETDDDRYDRDTERITYRCKLCGEEFHYDCESDWDCNDGDDQWEHLEMEHEEEYEECQCWALWKMLDEYFEREDD
jgi:hypothetical protein